MPGSPVIYYGDELGMGDNIFLGDRDGVRTPMQWSMDRNGGFSKADSARLYLPLIMDPVYGYQSVNVEAQERDPSSMLHFMRRMIALRRQHKAFGRGSLEFIRPDNRAILAFIRRYKGEVIMVVANLSRFVQPAELDLSEFNGHIPVEMIGRTDFPAIGELPYFITLGPHSFYWFRIESPAEPIKIVRAGTIELQKIPRITLEKMWDSLLEPHYLFTLGTDILPAYLARQRWFGGKAKGIATCSLVDWCKMGASFYSTFLRLQYESDEQEEYAVPMKIVQGQPALTLAEEIPDSVLAFVNNRKGDGILYDALMDRASYDIFLSAIGDGRQYKTAKGGTIKALPTKIYDALIGTGDGYTSVRKLPAEQSNTSIIIGDTFVLKLYRKLEKGINPDVEMSLYLTGKNTFSSVARVAGTLQYIDAAGQEATMGMLQEFIPNQGDGWAYTLAALGDYYQQAEKRLAAGESAPAMELSVMDASREAPPTAFTAMTDEYLQAIGIVGRRTAEFHLALAEEKKNPAFKPEKSTTAYTVQLAESVTRQIQDALFSLNGRMDELPPELRDKGHLVLEAAPALLDKVAKMSEMGTALGQLIRHHGDYHLGQILRTKDNDFILVDFEGEPLRPMAARRLKGSPLKDLAGMIRSFQYAAETALAATVGAGDHDDHADLNEKRQRLLPWGRAWYQWVSSVFVGAYWQTAAGAPFLPTAGAGFILNVFLLEKVFYELKYELNNRPDWLHIPLTGIVDIIESKRTSIRKK